MYVFKKEKYLELLNGKTAEWLARELGYTATTMSLIFNARKSVKKALAIAIVKTLDNNYEVEDFFEYRKGD